jgi:hypothetical protein
VAAGLHNRSAHGCRKIATTRAAHHGATVAELNAIFGWKGTAMASLYNEAAERERLALCAMAKAQSDADQNKTTTFIVAPSHEVRQITKKTNENSDRIWKWCGREDSNLHGLPR